MHYYDYTVGRRIAASGAPFYAVLQAAMRLADTSNLDKLKDAFPSVHAELTTRYNAPGGLLPGETIDPDEED
mgnify:CR=1 FL=1